MSEFREMLIDQLRKNRNDIIFLKKNLMVPEDIDRGPTEDMININDIIIPPWVAVVEIPTNPNGVSDQYNTYIETLDKCTKMIDALSAFDYTNDKLTYTVSDLYGTDLDKKLEYLQLSNKLITEVESLIPANFNMYLTQYMSYKNQLYYENYELLRKLRDYVNAYSAYIEGTIVEDTDEWLESFDTMFEDGMYCADFDENVQICMNQSLSLLTKYQAIIAHLYANYDSATPGKHGFIKALDQTISHTLSVMSTDYHLERSKCKLTPLTTTQKPKVIESILPKLPYDYVHERYDIEELNKLLQEEASAEDVVETSPHILEHSKKCIGDIVV